MQWKPPTSPATKRPRLLQLHGGGGSVSFGNAKGILFIGFLQRGDPPMESTMINLLKRKAIKIKRPGILTKAVLFHLVDTPTHKFLV